MKNLISPKIKQGFTLVEVMISTTIFAAVVGGVSYFLAESGKAAFIAEEKLAINYDIRELTNELITLGRGADRFYLYPSYTSSVYTATTNDDGDSVYGAERLGDGETGDLLLLIYEDSATVSTEGYPITDIIGIYRVPGADDTAGPVKIFKVEGVTGSNAYLKPEQLIPTVSEISDHDEVIEFAEGRSNGDLFYNYKDASVMINAKIIHGNVAKEITDTYNMTIKPRGGMN